LEASFTPKIKSLTFLILLVSAINLKAQKPHFRDKKVANDVLEYVSVLASDSMQGRMTASTGERMAAEYIAKEFKSIGLAPAGQQNFYQPIIVPNMRMANQSTMLMIADTIQTLFTDFYPVSMSTNRGQYSGETINIGYGIADDGLKHNDYRGKELEGRAVLLNIGIPGGSHPNNKFIGWKDIERRVEYAKSKGVLAVILYTTDSTAAPSGTLAKRSANSGIPVVYSNKDLGMITATVSEIIIDILMLSTNGQNVLGYIDNGAQNTVIIGAHHDHLGKGRKGGSMEENPTKIHNGADDNASGVAGLLTLAKEVKRKSKKYKNNNYLFIAFTGKEQGLIGSKHFINSALYAKYTVNYMLNMDMIGHLDSTSKTLIINGVGTSPAWKQAMAKTRICKRKIAEIKTTEGDISTSDHTSFYQNGIPAIHFFTGQHQHYHTSTDDVAIINAGGEAFVLRYMWKLMRKLDKQGKVGYTKTKDVSTLLNPKVYLGITPDYEYKGFGLRVDGIQMNKAGESAGLKKGDIILQIGSTKIQKIQDYNKVSNTFNLGEEINITVQKGTETKILKVQF
jgi:aminopeptidase YwaD|tara:strand:+ start:3311 stop:5008 length:1698 start_codon:yes stop_codon:yes gene_type:complete